MYQIDVENGKYTFLNNSGVVSIKRYGEAWRDESGDKALLCLLQHVEELELEIKHLKEPVKNVGILDTQEPCVGVVGTVVPMRGGLVSAEVGTSGGGRTGGKLTPWAKDE